LGIYILVKQLEQLAAHYAISNVVRVWLNTMVLVQHFGTIC
jgi:hypothetical protein